MIPRRICIAICAAALCFASTASAQLAANAKAPDFRVRTIDGKFVALSDYKGTVVLVNFWATWCTPCQTEMPRFIAFQKTYGAKGFQVVGISMDDSAEPVRAFSKKLNTNYPIAMGNAKLAESYGGVLGLPITFLIDRQGKIAKRYEGVVDLDSMEKDIQGLLQINRNHPDRDHH